MYSERGLDEWTRNETSHPGRLDDDDENEDQIIADIIREQQEDKKRAKFIRSLQGDTADTKETTIYFTKRKVGKW